jgi:hypothetical protein
MFSVVKVQPNLTAGSVVSFDPSLGVFTPAQTLATPLGVLQEDAQEAMIYNPETGEMDSQGYHVAPVSFAGVAFARCSRDIPNEGGELMVENGAVYVDNSADGAGIICPLPHDQEARLASSLVMVHIR